MSTEPPLRQAATERELPVVARNDLVISEVKFQNEPYWVIKDPLQLKYVRLDVKQFAILKLLDGKKNAKQIQTAFMQQFPGSRPTIREIHHLVFDLCKQGLAWSTRSGQANVLEQHQHELIWKKRFAALGSLMFIKLPGIDPQRFLDRYYSSARWLFHPIAVSVGMLLILFSMFWIAVNFPVVQQHVPPIDLLTSWKSLAIMWVVIGLTKIIHELGHAFACRHFNGECHEIGLAFLIFSPCLYCDVSDSWIISARWKRIFIAAAGMYVELVVSATAFLIWLTTNHGLLNLILFHTFAVTTVSVVIFNLNPLLRLDGYYILSDLLGMPNLRQKADKILGGFLGSMLFGIKPPVEPTLPSRRTFSLGVYALASAIYRWSIVVTICFILYQALKPFRLENLGILLGISSMTFAVGGLLTKTIAYVSRHRDQIGQSRRPVAATVALISFLAVFLLVPLPWYRQAECRLEPVDSRKIFAGTPGRLKSIHVAEGDLVRKGQILAILSNPVRADRYRELQTAFDVQQIEVQSQQATGDIKRETMARETLDAIRLELSDYRRQLQRTVIVAPCDGHVIAAPWKARPGDDANNLPTWSGSPLSLENTGCYLDAGVHLCSIAPVNDKSLHRYQAIMSVDQFDRSDFVAGSLVKLKVAHLPQEILRGKIEHVAISPRSEASGSQNGSLSQTSKLQSVADYQAVVSIQASPHELTPGMQASARVLVAKRTGLQWSWRYIRSTFSFAF